MTLADSVHRAPPRRLGRVYSADVVMSNVPRDRVASLVLVSCLLARASRRKHSVVQVDLAVRSPYESSLLRSAFTNAPFQAVLRTRHLDAEMERGRALRWVAGDEALIASRRIPSVRFAIIGGVGRWRGIP